MWNFIPYIIYYKSQIHFLIYMLCVLDMCRCSVIDHLHVFKYYVFSLLVSLWHIQFTPVNFQIWLSFFLYMWRQVYCTRSIASFWVEILLYVIGKCSKNYRKTSSLWSAYVWCWWIWKFAPRCIDIFMKSVIFWFTCHSYTISLFLKYFYQYASACFPRCKYI